MKDYHALRALLSRPLDRAVLTCQVQLRSRRTLATQLRSSRPFLVAACTGLAASIAVVFALHVEKSVPIGTMTRDLVAMFDAPVYFGLLSQLGIILWAMTVATCAVNAARLEGIDKSLQSFLLASAAVTLVLLLDDAFLLHEAVFPRLGIPEKAILLSYLVGVAGYAGIHVFTILKTNYVILGLAAFFFSVSLATDVALPSTAQNYLLEDGAKLAGIMFWFAYFVSVGSLAESPSDRST